MHIVYVCREFPPSLRGGGIASYLKEISSFMVQSGNEVTIICASDDTKCCSDEIIDGIRIIRLSGGNFIIPSVEKNYFFRKLRVFYKFYSYRNKVKKTIRTLKHVDVIECADFGAESLCLHHLGIPVIIRLHMPSFFDLNTKKMRCFKVCKSPFRFLAYLEKREIKKCNYITACSDSLAAWIGSQLQTPSNRIVSIPNPCNYSYISKQNFNNVLFDLTQINIVCVGTICETKGCGELLDACIALKKSFQNIHLWFFGKLGVWGEKTLEKYQMQPWIHVYGKIEREKLFGIYRNASVVVLPSWYDNFPMTCLEAMLSEGLVIGSTEGGMTQMIQNGHNGYIIPPKDSSLLRKTIEEVLNLQAEDSARLRKNAKTFVLNHFETKIVGRKMLDYYKFVIHNFTENQ